MLPVGEDRKIGTEKEIGKNPFNWFYVNAKMKDVFWLEKDTAGQVVAYNVETLKGLRGKNTE